MSPTEVWWTLMVTLCLNADFYFYPFLSFFSLIDQTFPVWDDWINTVRVLLFGDTAVTPHTLVPCLQDSIFGPLEPETRSALLCVDISVAHDYISRCGCLFHNLRPQPGKQGPGDWFKGRLKPFLLMTFKDPICVDWRTFHILLALSGAFSHGPTHGSEAVPRDLPLTRSLVVCLSENRVGGGCRPGCGCCAPVEVLLSAACSCWGSFTHTSLKKVSTMQRIFPFIYLFQGQIRWRIHILQRKAEVLRRSESFSIDASDHLLRSHCSSQILHKQQIWKDSIFHVLLKSCSIMWSI